MSKAGEIRSSGSVAGASSACTKEGLNTKLGRLKDDVAALDTKLEQKADKAVDTKMKEKQADPALNLTPWERRNRRRAA